MNNQKIAVLVSGGVDSSVALALLKEQSYNVTAFYLKIWLEDELSSLGSCPWEEDLCYVRKTCAMLDVPLRIISLQDEYHSIVVRNSIAALKQGLTPNPDIWCNEYIKFGAFLETIDTSYKKVATGHYAQIQNGLLVRSADPSKDQTYFLCNLSQAQLQRALFPIGHLTKEQVRTIAATKNLPAATRKDSQGICFLGKFKFRDFVKQHLGTLVGPFVDYASQKTIGTHEGHWFYTAGQRRNIRLSGGPWYVVGKNPTNNIVFISNRYEAIETPKQHFRVINMRWFSTEQTPKHPCTNITIKVRHRTQPAACTIDILTKDECTVSLKQSDQGIAPGQSAVFYQGNNCIASGIIELFNNLPTPCKPLKLSPNKKSYRYPEKNTGQ